MNIDLDRHFIKDISSANHYSQTNVEKVLRLCQILDDLNSIDELKGKLALKGGTAINLVAFDRLPRLSVDLDLDFTLNLSKENTVAQRTVINELLNDYGKSRNYEVSDRSNFILDSKSFVYNTSTGSRDKIKLDVNYHSRCHIFPIKASNVKIPFDGIDKEIRIRHLDIIELFAGKIKALYERCKPRDIYDVFSLAQSGLLSSPSEQDLLRKSVVFYSILSDSKESILQSFDIAKVRKMPFQSLKTQLLPMLHTNIGHFDKENLYEVSIEYIKNLMRLKQEEQEFLNSFYDGTFHPECLFPDNIAIPLYSHPMVIRNLQKIYGDNANQSYKDSRSSQIQ